MRPIPSKMRVAIKVRPTKEGNNPRLIEHKIFILDEGVEREAVDGVA